MRPQARPWREGLVGYDPHRVSVVETEDPDAVTDEELAAMLDVEGEPRQASSRFARRAYSPDQPRDTHGRFGHGDGLEPAVPDVLPEPGQPARAGRELAALARAHDWGPAKKEGDSEWTRWGYTSGLEFMVQDATESSKDVLNAYGYNGEDVVAALREWSGGGEETFRERADLIDEFPSSPVNDGIRAVVEIAEATPVDVPLYRGVGMDRSDIDLLTPGTTLPGKGLESWSRDPEVAKDFGTPFNNADDNVQVLLTLEKGAHGMDVAALGLDNYAWQDEVIVASNQYRIEDARFEPGGESTATIGNAPFDRLYLTVSPIEKAT